MQQVNERKIKSISEKQGWLPIALVKLSLVLIRYLSIKVNNVYSILKSQVVRQLFNLIFN